MLILTLMTESGKQLTVSFSVPQDLKICKVLKIKVINKNVDKNLVFIQKKIPIFVLRITKFL